MENEQEKKQQREIDLAVSMGILTTEFKNLKEFFIDFRTKLEKSVDSIKNDTMQRIIDLENTKANKCDLDQLQEIINKDHEKRISMLENWKSWILGGLGVIGGLVGWLALIKK